MRNFRLSELIWVLAAASVFAWLTLESSSYGSAAFEEQHHAGGFSPSQGWPLKCLIRASDSGADLAEASVVQGTVYRNAFKRGPRHLGISWPALIFDLLFALIIVVGPIVYFRLGRRRSSLDVAPPVR